MGEGADVDEAVSLVRCRRRRSGAAGHAATDAVARQSRLLTQMLRELDVKGSKPTAALREPTLDDVFLSLTGHAAEDGESQGNGRAISSATAVGTGRLPIVKRLRDRQAVFGGRYMIGRNLVAYKRTPQVLVFSTIQPIIFVLMFRYVFGGVDLASRGVDSLRRLPDAGRLRQTVVFGSIQTGVGLAKTCTSGFIERFPRCRWRAPRCSWAAPADLGATVRRHPDVRRRHDRGYRSTPTSSGCSPLWRWWCTSASRSPGSLRRSTRREGPGDRAGGGVPDPRSARVRLRGVRFPAESLPGWLQPWANHRPCLPW